jgi:hypothetical protein
MQFTLMRLPAANANKQLFHPLMSFVTPRSFMPGKITGTAIQLERQWQYLQI